MAVYRLEMSIAGRSQGYSAVAGAAYRSGERLDDERTGVTHDYRAKQNVVMSEIMTPSTAPEWARDRSQLWNAVERREDQHNRRDSAQLYKDLLLTLPHELTPEQNLDLVRSFVRREFVEHGRIADISIHGPGAEGDIRNVHAHVMLTMRGIEHDGFGNKIRDFGGKEAQLLHYRERWAAFQNAAFEELGLEIRLDHRSLADQLVNREPTLPLGKDASALERKGVVTELGDKNREITHRNEERAALQHQAEIIDLAVERQRRGPAQKSSDDREQERIAREQERLAAWAGNKQAALDKAQSAEQRLWQITHAKEQRHQDDAMAEEFGEAERKAREALAAIETNQQRRGLQRLWYRLSGAARKDEASAADERDRLKDVERQKTSRTEALALRQQEQREALQMHGYVNESWPPLLTNVGPLAVSLGLPLGGASGAKPVGRAEDAPPSGARFTSGFDGRRGSGGSGTTRYRSR